MREINQEYFCFNTGYLNFNAVLQYINQTHCEDHASRISVERLHIVGVTEVFTKHLIANAASLHIVLPIKGIDWRGSLSAVWRFAEAYTMCRGTNGVVA